MSARTKTRLNIRKRPDSHSGAMRGFTLIEMLISMVIFSMSIAIMSSALFQTGKVLTIVEKGDTSLIKQWRISKSIEEAIANLSVDAGTLETAHPPLQGSATQFSATTYRHPFGPQGQVLTLQASLRRLPDGSTAFEALNLADKSVLVGLVDAGPEFAYQDSLGKLHDSWPVRGTETEVLPRAIALRRPGSNVLLAWWPYFGRNFADQVRLPEGRAFFQVDGAAQ